MEDKFILVGEPCCDTIPTCPTQCLCDCDDQVNINTTEENKHMAFSKLASVLQDSVLYVWKMHLKAKKYSVHIILEEYYDEALDMIDALIEHYQGICKCDIVDYAVSDMIKSDEPYTYFISLKDYLTDFVNDSNNFNESTFEIKSDIDDILRLIDSTLYKLSHLTESKIKSFDAFVYESLL